jgi:hypothetical protein
MFIDKAKNRIVVGFDLGERYSQISYCRAEQSMPETISLVMGEEQYNIPTLLCRKKCDDGSLDWSVGKEALKNSSEGNGTLVEDLIQNVKNNLTLKVGEEEFTSDELLEAFLKKMLGLLNGYTGGDDIGAIAFTMSDLTTDFMDRIKAVMAKVCRNSMDIYFLSHEDCFFQYIIHQPEEMWIQDVLLFDYRADGVKSYMMSTNRKTSPVACFIESAFFPQMKINGLSEAFYRQLDSTFLDIVRKHCEGKVVTSVFLLGDYFSKDWCRESLKYMCRGRRVFQGNNLFGKGACYGAREKMFPSTLSTSYVYLSDDKLKANVGMTCDRGQTEVYYPILNAGTNWFDADKRFDVMLVKGNTITINIVPIDGRMSRTAKISLEGLKVRGNKTNRVGLHFYMENPGVLWIEITDLGFGEFFPSTGQVWKECIPVGGYIDE